MTTNAAAGVNAQPSASPRRIGLTLLGILLAMVLGMLDNMIVGTSMPTIVGELGGLDHISWVVTAYALATAVSTPIWGKFGDLFGLKRIYLLSIALFLIGSALCGTAGSMTELIEFRVLQGIGAGGLAGGAFALIGALVPPRERGRYMGISGAVMALGTIGGPLIGGFVTSGLGWRWAFYINIPLGVLALGWCWLMIKLPARRGKAVIDWPGIGLLTVTITAIVLATTWGGTEYRWSSWQILALIAAAVLGLVAFIARQRRAHEPVMPLRVFADRNYRLCVAMMCAAGTIMFGTALYLPLFQQTVQGASAANSGLLLLPMMIPVALMSQISGRLMTRTGEYKIYPILGNAFLVAGCVLLATMDTTTSRAATAVYMALLGVGLGLMMQIITTIAQNAVELSDMGVASSTIQMFRTVGGSLGVALFGSLFGRAIENGAHTGQVHQESVATGIDHVFLAAAVICAIALACAVFIKRVPLRGKPDSGAAPADAKPAANASAAR